MWRCWLPLMLLCSAASWSGVAASPHQHNLLQALLNRDDEKHNTIERPATLDNETVDVFLGFNIIQIITLDVKEQFLQSSMWVEQTWRDHTMQWDPLMYGNITTVKIPIDLIWRPDILLYNSADDKYDGTWPVNAVIQHSGEVSYIPPGMMKSTCKAKVEWFPFDEQECGLQFGSWTYHDREVNISLAPDPVRTKNFVTNGEFEIMAVTVKRIDKVFEYGFGHSENYPFVGLCFHVKRRDLYYVFNLVFPVMVLMFMSLLVFSLPAESGEKMGLSVTTLLSLTVYSTVVSESTPRTSDAVPILAEYFLIIMILCAAAVATQVYSLNINYNGCQHGLPRWTLKWICIRLANLIRLKIPDDILRLSEEAELHRNEAVSRSRMRRTWSFRTNDDTADGNLTTNSELMSSRNNVHEDGVHRDGAGDATATQLVMFAELRQLKSEFQALRNALEEKDEQELHSAVCEFASVVIDRTCLYIFSVTVAIIALLIFTWRPVYKEDYNAHPFCGF